MTEKEIQRINELYHKSKKEGLTPEEKREQAALREAYIQAIRIDVYKRQIYYSDRRDVYMETYLTEEELPDSELEVLKSGYYIKGVGELYDYLESITS